MIVKMATVSSHPISLLSLGLLEKDSNGDVLWTWAYPSATSEQRELFTRKCCLDVSDSTLQTEFTYGQYQHAWYYILRDEVVNNTKLSKVRAVAVVLMAKDFHPEKYEHVLRIMISEYQNSGSPVSMMQCYLDIITKGSTKSTVDEDICNVKDYSVSDAYLHYSIKDAIKKFGLETIIIYTAILLKKKVIVYHSKQEELQTFLRTLPLLVWHRHNWDILLPNVDLNENEINDLKTNGHYIAGFTDPAVENRMDLYDVFVNLQALEITTASHAKESMTMGKLHKEIALNMVQCTDNDDIGPKQAVKEISNKTKELLNNLHKLATVGDDGKARLSLETLKEQKFPHATENFLYNLAAAEGFVQL